MAVSIATKGQREAHFAICDSQLQFLLSLRDKLEVEQEVTFVHCKVETSRVVVPIWKLTSCSQEQDSRPVDFSVSSSQTSSSKSEAYSQSVGTRLSTRSSKPKLVVK